MGSSCKDSLIFADTKYKVSPSHVIDAVKTDADKYRYDSKDKWETRHNIRATALDKKSADKKKVYHSKKIKEATASDTAHKQEGGKRRSSQLLHRADNDSKICIKK